MMMLFSNCRKLDEDSEFLNLRNKRLMMVGDWVIDKAYGNGQDLTDSFKYNMPDFTYKITNTQIGDNKYDNYYYNLYIQNKRILFFGPLFYGVNFIEIPIITKNQTDSLLNNMPITYKELSNSYQLKSVHKNEIRCALYSNKYQEIYLKRKK